MRYILFAKAECPFCVAAVELLSEAKLQHNVINFEANQKEILNEIKRAHDWATVPMIFKREGSSIEFIGGFTDLQRHLGEDGG